MVAVQREIKGIELSLQHNSAGIDEEKIHSKDAGESFQAAAGQRLYRSQGSDRNSLKTGNDRETDHDLKAG